MTRRSVDVVVAVVFLILLSPLLLLVALAIPLDSWGSPLYRGWRIGIGGEPFRMWKFRTMVAGANSIGPQITARRDPRITRIGWFLRAAKIDELAQLINLLAGDITLVGPRAEVQEIVERYTAEQRRVLSVKPGLTGPGQIYYTTDQAELVPDAALAQEYYTDHLLADKLRIDMEYIQSRTAFSDVRIVFQTAYLVFRALISLAGPQCASCR